MGTTTLALLWEALIVSWLLIPIVVIQYRLVVVPRRYAEIEDHFMGGAPIPTVASGRGEMSAGEHYARLHNRKTGREDAQQFLAEQFWHFHGWSRYAIPLIAVMLLSGLMLYFSGLWIEARLIRVAGSAPSLLDRIDPPFVMALWGAFVWSLNEIWSRRVSGDLTPIELFDVAVRFVVAIPIGYAFSLLVFETVPSLAAFVASAFPLRDARQLLRKQALKKLGEDASGSAARVSGKSLGDVVTGMGNDTIVRLQELNIETFQDLAYTDPIRLMVKTGVPIQLVLAWIDQALLAVYLAPHKETFNRLGMPCALDVREFYLNHLITAAGAEAPNWRTDPAVTALATEMKVAVDSLPQPLRSIYEDPQVKFLAAAWYRPEDAVVSRTQQ